NDPIWIHHPRGIHSLGRNVDAPAVRRGSYEENFLSSDELLQFRIDPLEPIGHRCTTPLCQVAFTSDITWVIGFIKAVQIQRVYCVTVRVSLRMQELGAERTDGRLRSVTKSNCFATLLRIGSVLLRTGRHF